MTHRSAATCAAHVGPSATVRNGGRSAASAGWSRRREHPGARVSMAETLIGGAWQQPQFAESDVRHSQRRTCNTPPAAPRGCWPHCRTRSMPASTSLPPERGLPWPARPAGTNPPPGARHCSNARISPLSGGTSTVTTSPRPPALRGMPAARARHRRQLLRPRRRPPDHRAAMPRRPEIAASSKSPCAMTLRILHQSSSQADSERSSPSPCWAAHGWATTGFPVPPRRTHGHPDPGSGMSSSYLPLRKSW